MYCTKCGTKAIDGALFCQKCGTRLIQENREEKAPVLVSGQESKIPTAPAGSELKSEPKSEPAGEGEAAHGNGPVQVLSPEPNETLTTPAEPMAVSASGQAETSVSCMESVMKMAQTSSSGSAGTSASFTEPVMETLQDVNIQEKPFSIPGSDPGSDRGIYALLKENIGMCPAIKSAKQVKKGVRLRGKIYDHFVRLAAAHTVHARMKSVLQFPLSLLYGLLVGLLCFVTGLILAEFVKYGSICIEYYHGILFSLCCLTMGAVISAHAFVGRKEKETVKVYVRKILDPKQINLFEGKWIGASTIKVVAAVIMVVAGIIALPFSLPKLQESIEYSDELLFGGLPAARILEMTQRDMESEFGKPNLIYSNMATGDDCYNYTYSGSDSIGQVIYSKENGKVIYVRLSAADCSCNGKKLNKSLERVLDILSEGYGASYYSFGVYGSIHNGFYYDDVYFGETLSAEEYLAQQEFEDGRDFNYRFMSLDAYGEEYYNSELMLNGREKQDYKINLIIGIHKFMDDLSGVYDVCLYTDEWVEKMNAIAAPDERTDANGTDDPNTEEVLYKGIPVNSLFEGSAAQAAEILGLPSGQDRDDDIRLYITDEGGVESLEIWNPSALTMNGENLGKNRDGLIAVLGSADKESYSQGEYGMKYLFESYSLYFELSETEAWRVTVYPVRQEASAGYVSYTMYFEDDNNSRLELYPDGTFCLFVNLYEGEGTVTGRYYSTGSNYGFAVTSRDFSGFIGDDVDEFAMAVNGNTLIYYGDEIGAVTEGSEFRLYACDDE